MQKLLVAIGSDYELPGFAFRLLLPWGCPCRHAVGYCQVLRWHTQSKGVDLIGVEEFVAATHEVARSVQLWAVLDRADGDVEDKALVGQSQAGA